MLSNIISKLNLSKTGLSRVDLSKISLSKKVAKHLSQNVLLTIVLSVGLSACSTAQMSQPTSEPAVSTVSPPVAVTAPASEKNNIIWTDIDPKTGVYPMPEAINDMPPLSDD